MKKKHSKKKSSSKKVTAKKSAPNTTKKKAAKKAKPRKRPIMAVSAFDSFTKWRAVCMECNWKAKVTHDSENEAIDYGIDKHGDKKDHEIDAVGTQ
jgi:hypothetical protein